MWIVEREVFSFNFFSKNSMRRLNGNIPFGGYIKCEDWFIKKEYAM